MTHGGLPIRCCDDSRRRLASRVEAKGCHAPNLNRSSKPTFCFRCSFPNLLAYPLVFKQVEWCNRAPSGAPCSPPTPHIALPVTNLLGCVSQCSLQIVQSGLQSGSATPRSKGVSSARDHSSQQEGDVTIRYEISTRGPWRPDRWYRIALPWCVRVRRAGVTNTNQPRHQPTGVCA